MVSTARATRRADRRMLMHMPVHVGTFLDLVCKYTGRRKRVLMDQVWAAGMRAVFGISPEELAASPLTIPIDVRTDPQRDLKELTNLLCGAPE
jgi:hypothetical protein